MVQNSEFYPQKGGPSGEGLGLMWCTPLMSLTPCSFLSFEGTECTNYAEWELTVNSCMWESLHSGNMSGGTIETSAMKFHAEKLVTRIQAEASEVPVFPVRYRLSDSCRQNRTVSSTVWPTVEGSPLSFASFLPFALFHPHKYSFLEVNPLKQNLLGQTLTPQYSHI